jgi:DnaJ-class molecular chaperone
MDEKAPEYNTCDNCEGTGNLSEYDDYYQRCPQCGGKGWIKE